MQERMSDDPQVCRLLQLLHTKPLQEKNTGGIRTEQEEFPTHDKQEVFTSKSGCQDYPYNLMSFGYKASLISWS